jgi:hypothetical protein
MIYYICINRMLIVIGDEYKSKIYNWIEHCKKELISLKERMILVQLKF